MAEAVFFALSVGRHRHRGHGLLRVRPGASGGETGDSGKGRCHRQTWHLRGGAGRWTAGNGQDVATCRLTRRAGDSLERKGPTCLWQARQGQVKLSLPQIGELGRAVRRQAEGPQGREVVPRGQ